jgi:hypothetical protein
MIHQLLTTEYLFWIVAVFFYFLDSIKLIGKFEILISETFTGKYKPSFSFNTFEIKGQQVQLLNFFLPFTGFLILNTIPNQSSSKNFEDVNKKLTAFQKVIFPFKIISIISFFYLLSGPILTYYLGFASALAFLFPIHLTTLLATLLLLLISRKRLNFSYGTVVYIFFDCLVVPAYLPSIVRKIYKKTSFSCDGYYFSLKTCSEDDREDLEYKISRKINQLIEQLDDDDSETYYSYKNYLGIKNDQL